MLRWEMGYDLVKLTTVPHVKPFVLNYLLKTQKVKFKKMKAKVNDGSKIKKINLLANNNSKINPKQTLQLEKAFKSSATKSFSMNLTKKTTFLRMLSKNKDVNLSETTAY